MSNNNNDQRFCPSCGAPVEEGAMMCSNCGALLINLNKEKNEKPYTETPNDINKRNDTDETIETDYQPDVDVSVNHDETEDVSVNHDETEDVSVDQDETEDVSVDRDETVDVSVESEIQKNVQEDEGGKHNEEIREDECDKHNEEIRTEEKVVKNDNSNNNNNKQKGFQIAIIVCLIVIAALIGALIFTLMNQNKKQDATVNQPEKTEEQSEEQNEEPDEEIEEYEEPEELPPVYEDAYVEKIDATSTLEVDDRIYPPENVFDSDYTTCWSEGVDGWGQEESIIFYFDRTVILSGMYIGGGFQKSEELYYQNGRPRVIECIFSDGTKKRIEMDDLYDEQWFQFGNGVKTEFMEIVIKSVYEGDTYEDTCISDISLY